MFQIDRRTAASAALVAAPIDAAGALALGLMYAIEVPRGGPYRWGTANDVSGAVHNVLLFPVVAVLSEEVAREMPPSRAMRTLTTATLGSCAVGAASSALLVARVLPFGPSTAASVAALSVQTGWLLATSRHLRSSSTTTGRALGQLGRGMSIALLGGAAVVASSQIAPKDGRMRRALLVTGIAAGGAAWLAWPAWMWLAGRHLRA